MARSTAVADHYAPKLASATADGHAQVLKDMTADAWVQGVFVAAGKSAAVKDGLTDATTLGADADDWEPGWAETADLPSELPAPLQALIDSTSNAIQPTDENAAGAQAATQSAYADEAGAQQAYDDGGVDQFNVVPDGGACEVCQGYADGGPYDTGDDDSTPPFHTSCGCDTEPVEPADTEARGEVRPWMTRRAFA